MVTRTWITGAVGIVLTVVACSCSTARTTSAITPGMSPDQTVQAMGQPDLKDSISDPNHSGATVLRYVWLDSGKVAVFSPDNKVASVQQIEPAEKTQAEAEVRSQEPPSQFDPLATPLGYAFFPIKAAFIYLGAGLNCLGGGGCHQPQLPDPSRG